MRESHAARQDSFLLNLPSRLINTLSKKRGKYDYSHEVHASMMGCLACKSCVSQCPIKVNVPDFRARFLELYYARYLRPGKDYLIGGLEYMIPWLAKWPKGYNWLMNNGVLKALLRKQAGMVDSPRLSEQTLAKALKKRNIALADRDQLDRLTATQRQHSVILVQDAFTSYFESQLVADLADLLRHLGFHVYIAPFRPNGKPLHVHGFLGAFEKAAIRNTDMLRELAQSGVPLVGIDPSMTLTYREEYAKLIPAKDLPEVRLIQEWLVEHLDALQPLARDLPTGDYQLLAHCTEKTAAAPTLRHWQAIYQALGQKLEVLAAGCCGMSGTYGHETQNLQTSKDIYQLSWAGIVEKPEYEGSLVATGYSCRSQVKRLSERDIPHPIQPLLRLFANQRN